MRTFLLALFLVLSTLEFAIPSWAASSPAQADQPKLILVFLIDQFRADYLNRFHRRFLPAKNSRGALGGFQHLISSGAYYPQAHYDVLQNMTCTGHATILTGSYPYQNGIPMNYWYDDEKHVTVYCVEDPSTPLVGTEVKKPHLGSSPKNLLATTVGDELKNAGYPSRVVSVALKDRAAILLGGHRADLALWYDDDSDQWISSKFYLPDGRLPLWVQALNEAVKKSLGKTWEWKLDGPGTGFSDNGTFPHQFKYGTKESLASPIGLDMTVLAAQKAIEAYQLGRGKAVDLMAVSFSSPDLVGHKYGPNSREVEEISVAVDRSISTILNLVKAKVPGGLKNVVVVLTGDHGVAPIPAWAKQHRLDAGMINEGEVETQINTRLDDKFGKPKKGNWIQRISTLNVFINQDAIAEKNLDPANVENEAKKVASAFPGVATAFTQSDYMRHHLPPGIFERQINHTYFPERSGDLVIIPRPFYTTGEEPSQHMTGYSYDRTVPILLSGFHIKHGLYSLDSNVVDIAPTLSFLSGTVPPSVSEGRVLTEAISE